MAALTPNLSLLRTSTAPAKTQYVNNLSSLNLGNVGKPTTIGITNTSVLPSQLKSPVTASPAATTTKPVSITTPQNTPLKSPAAQSFISSQLGSPETTSTLRSIADQVSALTGRMNGGNAESTQTATTPNPVKSAPTPYETALQKYLDTLDSSSKLDEKATKETLDANHKYQTDLDTPGGLVSGARETAALDARRSNASLADLGIAQNSANTAEKLALARLQFEQGNLPNSDPYTLSAGQTRYDAKGNIIATGGPDTVNPTASIQEYNFAKQQGYSGTFEDFKNGGGANNANAILTPSEAQALGVPYGTTRQQAYGSTPTKPLTESQAKDVTYGQRGNQANTILNDMESVISKYNPAAFAAYSAIEPNAIGNSLVPDDIRQIRQAERNFATAVLRRESGASISPTEFSTVEKQYFPRPGDDAKTLKQKAQNRTTAINSFMQNAGQSGIQNNNQGGVISWDSL